MPTALSPERDRLEPDRLRRLRPAAVVRDRRRLLHRGLDRRVRDEPRHRARGAPGDPLRPPLADAAGHHPRGHARRGARRPRPAIPRSMAHSARRRRLPLHPRTGLRHRPLRLVLAHSRARVRRARRPASRAGDGRPRRLRRLPVPVLGRARRGRGLPGRRLRRRLGDARRGARRPLHLLPGRAHPLCRGRGRRRRAVAERPGRAPLHREDLAARLPHRRRHVRRRVEHAPARAPDRGVHDGPRSRLRAGGDADPLHRGAPAPAPHRAADHHPAVRDRPRPHPPLRPLRSRQPAPRVEPRRAAVAVDLRAAGRVARADASRSPPSPSSC